MKKYVVVGGAGYIGANLVDTLLAENRGEVHVIDNLVGGKKEHVHKDALFHEVDMRDLAAISPIIEGADTVFVLAALPRVQYSIDNPIETNDVNVGGVLNVYIASQKGGVRRVVYSASSSAYGDQKTLPLVETMPTNPLSPYGLQKYIGEMYGKVFHQIHGLEVVSLRYFNVYGGTYADPEGAYALVIPKFFKMKAEGKPLTVTGDGTQTRDFTHITDIVRANILASESTKVGEGEAINIGSGENCTIGELAKMISDDIEYIEARQETHDTLADYSKAKELLGWVPKVTLEEGIAMMK